MKTLLFDYSLPKSLIAQSPAIPHDTSRLMLIDRKTGKITHHKFYEIENFLNSNDVLVLNQTKVFPARIFAEKVTGGKVEILFIEEVKPQIWTALTHPGLKLGTNLAFKKFLFNIVGHKGVMVQIDTHLNRGCVMQILSKHGHTPLPPYIKSGEKEIKLRKEYQTVFATKVGSVAAPTAGFHFTKKLLKRLREKGVQIEYITLHVGLGTFLPVKTKNIEEHKMHFEYFELEKSVADRLNRAQKSGKRIIATGTTSTRVLETCASKNGLRAKSGETNLYIYPPYRFRSIDSLITNFHLPESTLLALVSAFVSYPNTNRKFRSFKTSLMGKAYLEAIKEKYRFYSFGDACLII